jgi:hypothetical protein
MRRIEFSNTRITGWPQSFLGSDSLPQRSRCKVQYFLIDLCFPLLIKDDAAKL